jgi:DNA-binding transcriptional MerR regulator
MQRAGNRRYYRPSDVELARRIHRLLSHEGYTVRGVQKLLRERSAGESSPVSPIRPALAPEAAAEVDEPADQVPTVDVFRLIALRDRLSQALEG